MPYVWTDPNFVSYEKFYVDTANKQDKIAIDCEKNVGKYCARVQLHVYVILK